MESLTDFKKKYPLKEKVIDNYKIQFYSNNVDAKNTLIFFPGTSGKVITYHQMILNFDDSFNIIAIDYPIIANIDELTQVLENFIGSFNMNNISLVGNSFGTLIIQMLIKNSSLKYQNIYLINPTTKNINVKPEDIQGHVKSYKKQLHVLNGIFPFLYKTSYKKNIKVMVYNSSIEDKKKWYKFYLDLFNQTERQQSIAIYECLLDFWQSKNFLRSDFMNFKNKVHILESDINLSQSKSEFDSVPILFKNHEVNKLPGNRNLTLIKHNRIISNIIKNSFK